jgi:hypothetical protein
MQWYIAKIVFRIICGEGDHKPQFDEQLRLIHAADEQEAFRKAEATGWREEDSFLNQQKQLVQWQFINISELKKLSALSDGIELYSRVKEADNAKRYIDVINKKAEQICSTFENRETVVA